MKTNLKIQFLLAAFLGIWLAGCTITSPPDLSPEKPPQLFDIPWDDRSLFSAGLINSEQQILAGLPGASVYHIDFTISDDLHTLSGWQEVHYTNREALPLTEIYFQLFPNAAGGKTTISSLSVNGQNSEPVYEFLDSALLLDLPTPLEPNESIDIRMEFSIDLALQMEGNYGLFGYFEDVIVLDGFYPVIPVYDDEAWNVQFPPANADTSYYDASFYLVRVTAPANLTIAATGVGIEHQSEGDTQTIEYAAGPARDFYMAASEHYISASQMHGETLINIYAREGNERGAEDALQFTKDAIQSFTDRFGPYPYTEFDVLATPMLALGIEYPGIVGVVSPAFDPNEIISGLPYPIMLESVVAHEVAHQWFYNLIGNDQIDEPWLDEAMAQYSTWLYFVDTYGEANAQGYIGSWDSRWDRVNREEIPIGLAAATYEGSEYSAIIYGRGPLFVQALAEEMGQQAFDEFLKAYYQSHKWGIATADSLKQTAELQCGCDLTPLFEAWVYPQ